MASLKKNYMYNAIYQTLTLLIPLVSAPYLSRTIGAEGVGVYSYTYSIVYYFMLFCLLGVNNYGNRTIAKCKNNKEDLNRNFWEIYMFQFIFGIFLLIVYILYVTLSVSEYKVIYYIQSFFIISAILDISWLYFGLEEFKKTILRNSIVKISTLLFIFLFVRSNNDLYKYVFIMAGMTSLSQFVLWLSIRKYISFNRVSIKGIIKHIRPNAILFIPIIAISLYKIMDKIMLGMIAQKTDVGFYESAEKIVHVPLTLISSLGIVLMPRISNSIASGNGKSVENTLKKSLEFISFISFCAMFGLFAVGFDFAPFFYGREFVITGYLIPLLAVTIPFVSCSYILKTGYCIPFEKDKIYIISVGLGAVVNLILNALLIPKYTSVGACIATIVAEISVFLYQYIMMKKLSGIKVDIKPIFSFFIKSLIMFIFIWPIRYCSIPYVLKLIAQVCIGGLLYAMQNINYIKSIISR